MKPLAPVFHLQEIGVVKSPVVQNAPICRAVRKGQIDRVLRLVLYPVLSLSLRRC